MTEQATTTEATASAPPAPAPAVDADAIRAEVSKATKEAMGTFDANIEKRAAEIAQAQVKKAFKSLAGEPEKEEMNPVLVQLINDPVGSLREVKNVAKEEVKQELSEAAAKKRAFEDDCKEAAAPYFSDYPEISQNLDLVDGLIQVQMSKGKPVKEAVDFAFKETVKRLGLKNAAEVARIKKIQAVGLPVNSGMGGSASAAPRDFNDATSTNDYLKAQRDKARSFRVKA